MGTSRLTATEHVCYTLNDFSIDYNMVSLKKIYSNEAFWFLLQTGQHQRTVVCFVANHYSIFVLMYRIMLLFLKLPDLLISNPLLHWQFLIHYCTDLCLICDCLLFHYSGSGILCSNLTVNSSTVNVIMYCCYSLSPVTYWSGVL